MKKEKYCAGCGMKLNKDGICECGENCKCSNNCTCNQNCHNEKPEKYNKTGLIIVFVVCFIFFVGFIFIGGAAY